MPVSAKTGAAFDRLLKDLGDIFGARLQSLVVYGRHAKPAGANHPDHEWREANRAIRTLVLVEMLTAADLARCALAGSAWARSGLATPLLVTAEEFTRSLDAFPLEYSEIIAAHEVVSGKDPFDGVRVAAEDIRRACEIQAKSHLLHLREGYIESGAKPAAVARLIVRSAPPFRALLSHVARLRGAAAGDDVTLASRAASTLGLDESVIAEVVGLRRERDLSGSDAARLFPAYLDAAERLARFVDRWP